MKKSKTQIKAMALALVLILCLPLQAFALDLTVFPNNTIKLGDDFFSMDSNEMLDPKAVVPITSLLAEGNNKNKGYFKFGDLWYDVFSLDSTQLLNPDYALTADQLAEISGGNKWYKAGGEVVDLKAKTVASLGLVPDISVYVGKDTILLPQTVSATLGDSTTADIPVTWDTGTPVYDKYTAGEYVYTGTLMMPDGITNPLGLYSTARVIVSEANSLGTTLYEMEGLEELQPSVTAAVYLDSSNSLYGNASVKLAPLSPVAVDADSYFYSVVANGIPAMAPSSIDNLEFSVYVPDASQIEYLLVKFYTDIWHNVFYENGIGGWELNNGWNKIRRTLSDFRYVNSTATASSSYASARRASSSGSNDELVMKQQEMNESIELLDNITRGQKKSSLLRGDASTESTEEITATEIYVVYTAGKSPEVSIDRIGYNVSGTPKILFTFDDAWLDVITYGKPILDTRGFKATTWANMEASMPDGYWGSDRKESFWFMNEEKLAFIYEKGWDIGNHTYSHPDTIIDEETMRTEYLTNQQWIVGKEWPRGAYHVCYPSGSYSDNLISILKSIGVKTARTTVHGGQPTPVPDLYKLKCINVSRDTDMAFIEAEIDRAIATGSSIFFMFHRVEPVPEDDTVRADDGDYYGGLAVSTAKLTSLVDYIYTNYTQTNKVDVTTISQWYDTYMRLNP